jgi:hypothetical protein
VKDHALWGNSEEANCVPPGPFCDGGLPKIIYSIVNNAHKFKFVLSISGLPGRQELCAMVSHASEKVKRRERLRGQERRSSLDFTCAQNDHVYVDVFLNVGDEIIPILDLSGIDSPVVNDVLKPKTEWLLGVDLQLDVVGHDTP